MVLLESCLQTCMTYTIAECTVNELLMMERGTVYVLLGISPANYNLTPGKYPKEHIQYSNHGESLKSRERNCPKHAQFRAKRNF